MINRRYAGQPARLYECNRKFQSEKSRKETLATDFARSSLNPFFCPPPQRLIFIIIKRVRRHRVYTRILQRGRVGPRFFLSWWHDGHGRSCGFNFARVQKLFYIILYYIIRHVASPSLSTFKYASPPRHWNTWLLRSRTKRCTRDACPTPITYHSRPSGLKSVGQLQNFGSSYLSLGGDASEFWERTREF